MTTNNVETLPNTPKPQTTREVIQANVARCHTTLSSAHSNEVARSFYWS